MIWQTMMGESVNPKQRWDPHDERFQHFSAHIGHHNTGRIKPGDTFIIYWPGQSVYMGISVAAESGPYRLSMSKQEAPQNIDDWPYGLRISNLIKIDGGQ